MSVVSSGNTEPNERAPREWPKFMTARVAADYADTSPWTVRRHVRPCGRRGRSFVYAIEDVERWMRGEPLMRHPVAAEQVPVRQSPTEAVGSVARIRSLGRTRRNRSPSGSLADDTGDVSA